MPSDEKKISVSTGLEVVLGIWLAVSPAFVRYPDAAHIPGVTMTFGLVIALLGSANGFARYRIAWISWLNALLGVAVLSMPWVVGFAAQVAPMWNCVITGLAVACLSLRTIMASDAPFVEAPRRAARKPYPAPRSP